MIGLPNFSCFVPWPKAVPVALLVSNARFVSSTSQERVESLLAEAKEEADIHRCLLSVSNSMHRNSCQWALLQDIGIADDT